MIIDAHTHLNTNQLFWDYKKYLENFEKIWWKIVVNAWANNEYNQKWIQIAKESIKDLGKKNAFISLSKSDHEYSTSSTVLMLY